MCQDRPPPWRPQRIHWLHHSAIYPKDAYVHSLMAQKYWKYCKSMLEMQKKTHNFLTDTMHGLCCRIPQSVFKDSVVKQSWSTQNKVQNLTSDFGEIWIKSMPSINSATKATTYKYCKQDLVSVSSAGSSQSSHMIRAAEFTHPEHSVMSLNGKDMWSKCDTFSAFFRKPLNQFAASLTLRKKIKNLEKWVALVVWHYS